MNKIRIQLAEGNAVKGYDIVIGSNLLGRLGEIIDLQGYSRIALLSDNAVFDLYGQTILDALPQPPAIVTLPPGEEAKNLMSFDFILNKFAEAKLDRSSLLLNLGGGVIGDLGGFVAASYMRGIDFVQIPTTLLSQVDASVGGKTGVNFAGVKNLVGAFYQPRSVIIDVDTLQSLPPRELRSGFAEVIKHGLIANEDYLKMATGTSPDKLSAETMISIVTGSCEIKSKVVEADEKEAGLRKILNFGHTFGHAYESVSHEEPGLFPEGPLHHGEAVALGMVAESYLSYLSGNITAEDLRRIENTLSGAGLPIRTGHIEHSRLLLKMKSDKKNSAGEIRWTLLKGIGEAVVDQVLSEELVLEAMNYMTGTTTGSQLNERVDIRQGSE